MEFFETALTYLREYHFASAAVRLVLAAVLGGIIGFERERHGRAAGLRTHILVCLGSAIATLIGHYNMAIIGQNWGDPMRIGAQVLSGIGFLGAGTIISKGRFQVTGLTTAAGLWAPASIGLAIGIGFYEAAIIGTLIVILTMSLLTKFDANIIKKSTKLRVYLEINDVNKMNTVVDMLITNYDGSGIQVTVPRSGVSGNAGIEATLHVDDESSGKEVILKLSEDENIVYALPSI